MKIRDGEGAITNTRGARAPENRKCCASFTFALTLWKFLRRIGKDRFGETPP
jgi:hypothetical protein